MSGQRFQARAKTVQKLGRDGLVEQNVATGEETRVSGRTSDISFGPERKAEQAAGHRAAQRGNDDAPAKKRRKQPRPTQQTAEETAYAAQAPSRTTEPPVPDTSSMRMAADAPLMDSAVIDEDIPPPPPVSRKRRQQKRKNRKKINQRQAAKFSSDAARSSDTRSMRVAGDILLRNQSTDGARKRRPIEGGGRLNFEAAEGEEAASDGKRSADAKVRMKKRQMQRQMRHFAPDAAQPAANGEHRSSHFMNDGGGRLRFEQDVEDDALTTSNAGLSEEAKRAVKKRQVMDSAADAANVAQRRRLQFEDDVPPKADTSPAQASKEDGQAPNRKYDKAVRKAEQAQQKVEQARENLPTKRRLSIQPEADAETGKPRRRLHFEQEVLPEYRKPSLPARAGDMIATTAVMKLHGKVRESERDNVAVEASHKSELFAEQGAGRALRWERNRLRSKPYRALRQAERVAAKENAELAWQSTLRDNPELQRKHILAKWMQKRKIQRKYAQAAHEAKQTAQFTQNVVHATGQIVRAIQQFVAARKSVLAAVALLALVVVFFSAGMTSCTAMLSAFQSSYISASYMANEQDICNADLYYTELETDLQIDINKTEENYPGYDGYSYDVGEIIHSPYELLAYLSTKFNAFKFAEVKAELDSLFAEQYELTREVVDGNILKTTLTVRPLSTVINSRLASGEQTDRYGVYMQTLGNRQAYGNPFDFSWLNYVSSGYGYRVHPISGEKSLHRGVDIGADEGTPIKAIQDGRVISAGETDGYGLCVVIEDDKGYQSRYGHCSSLYVSAGQEVKRGDVIAAVGSTGQSTGPHLHLEVMLDGEYLNPYYFVDTGYDGTGSLIPGAPSVGPVYSEYPGEPPSDDVFAAMLAEAQKYLGYPYVWGGSSPSTSFDCSGFVCWVLNHSGWSVGRTTAQGLYNYCTPVSPADAKPGDLIFFQGTYASSDTVTHIGIYVGNGQMIHCGNPISYASINSSYWQQHFYSFGRLP